MTLAAPPAVADPLFRAALQALCGTRLVERLTERHLRILRASIIEGRPYDDIGAGEGVTGNAIKVSLTRMGIVLGFEMGELRPKLLAGYWWLAGTLDQAGPGGFNE